MVLVTLAGDDLTVVVRLDLPHNKVERAVHLRENRITEGRVYRNRQRTRFLSCEPSMQKGEPGGAFTISFRAQRH